MISENPAVKLEDGTKVCRHTVEVLCPNCSRDVDEAELAAQKCNDCGADLSDPKQHIAVAVTSVPVLGITW
jgi:Zn finger protein HypA/HybF involved in hydrogenase expression